MWKCCTGGLTGVCSGGSSRIAIPAPAQFPSHLPPLAIDPSTTTTTTTTKNTQPHNKPLHPPSKCGGKERWTLYTLNVALSILCWNNTNTSQFLRHTRKHAALSMKIGYNLTHSILWKKPNLIKFDWFIWHILWILIIQSVHSCCELFTSSQRHCIVSLHNAWRINMFEN